MNIGLNPGPRARTVYIYIVNTCPFARTGPLRTKSQCEVPMRFTPGWHSGDADVCLWAVHGATELRVFTVVAFCAAWNGGGVL